MKNKNISIREWYIKNYPHDIAIGKEIKNEITFEGLFRAMDNYTCVYKYLGVDDSLIRERAFEKLAEIMDCDYDYIYEQWLKGGK